MESMTPSSFDGVDSVTDFMDDDAPQAAPSRAVII
jgi:hypothetical protein